MNKKKEAALAKISRPGARGVYPRKRLFKILERDFDRKAIWISGPPGAGKTILANSFLDAHNLSSLWYQVDEGDGDIASFFHYMGLAARKAAPRVRKPLPVLTPEYLQGISTFTKRYFEKLYARLKTPFSVVLDN